MDTLQDKIGRKLHDFINKILFLEKRNVFHFEGVRLYPSEIHLILVMSDKPTNATQMAEALHITKGAVSQTISRLVKKGVMKKTTDPYSKNELTLTFTPLGERVFDKYKELDRTMDVRLKEKLSSFSQDELLVLDRFFDQMMDLPEPADEI